MSESAIFNTTEALQVRVAEALGGAVGQVHIGAPLRNEVGQNSKVSLFLFHLQVNAELRNEQRYSPPPLGPAIEPVTLQQALPLDLRFLITVFRVPSLPESPPNELTTLGQIIQTLHVQPMLSGDSLDGQVVRMTPEPYPMEELSRVWGLFPQDVYRTSVVYLASPVFIDAGQVLAGLPVKRREQRSGLSTEVPNVFRKNKRESNDT